MYTSQHSQLEIAGFDKISKVAVVLLVLPQSSVAVNVTVIFPTPKQAKLEESKELVQVTPPKQSSKDWAPPLTNNQLENSSVFPLPSQSTVALTAGIIFGGETSCVENVAVVLTSCPQSSVAVNVTVTDGLQPKSSWPV